MYVFPLCAHSARDTSSTRFLHPLHISFAKHRSCSPSTTLINWNLRFHGFNTFESLPGLVIAGKTSSVCRPLVSPLSISKISYGLSNRMNYYHKRCFSYAREDFTYFRLIVPTIRFSFQVTPSIYTPLRISFTNAQATAQTHGRSGWKASAGK